MYVSHTGLLCFQWNHVLSVNIKVVFIHLVEEKLIIYSTPEICGSKFNNSQLPIIRARIIDVATYP